MKTLTEINEAFEDSEDGLIHWSAPALIEAGQVVEHTLGFIEHDYPNARVDLRKHYDEYKLRLLILRDHINRCLNVPAQSPA